MSRPAPVRALVACAGIAALVGTTAGCAVPARPYLLPRRPSRTVAVVARSHGDHAPRPDDRADVLPAIVNHGDRGEPLVALTFDSNLTDSMIRELDQGKVHSFANTQVIDVLERLHVPTTFFLAGKWMERYPDVTRRLAADPLFELGSHSYEHRAYARRCYGLGVLPASRMADDVRHSFDVLRRFTDHPTDYFRFPGGCYDAHSLAAVAATGVQIIGYDVPGADPFQHAVAPIVRAVVDSARNGSIIILHITGGNTAPRTADALPAIVDGLRARGFRLVKVSELLAAGNVG